MILINLCQVSANLLQLSGSTDHCKRTVNSLLSFVDWLTSSFDLQVDIAVVETGLGGIRDATNVFGAQQLLLAIITALGLEHQGALGQFHYKLPPSQHMRQNNLEHQIFSE